MLNSADLNTKINQEISKSFRNVNYSQWERQSKQTSQSNIKKTAVERQSTSSLAKQRPPSTNDAIAKACEPSERRTFSNPRPGALGKITFKSRKQEIEEEARRNLLKTKIKFTKQNILDLKDRAQELTEVNLDIIEYIEKTEKTANDSVDKILRKYERYQDVLKTIDKNHLEDMNVKKNDLKSIKTESKLELPRYEKDSNNVEGELKKAQILSETLSIYKNQEYPEKVLQINNLRKNLEDLKLFQEAEKESFLQMIEDDKNREKASQVNLTENIANDLTSKVVDEMHYSLKEMALDNQSMKNEVKFFKNLRKDLKDEIELLRKEVNVLKNDKRINNKAVIFGDVFVEHKICTPDMDVVLDLPKNELY